VEHRVRVGVIGVLGVVFVLVGSWQGFLKVPRFSGDTAGIASYEMAVERLESTRRADAANVILKEKRGNRRLVVVVGLAEALAIQSDLNNVRSEQPMTYDLMRSMVKELGGQVNSAVINNVTDTTFFAKVVMDTDGRQIQIDSRPSDAIALALRAKVPIYADASVLDKAGVVQTTN
jgi:bifunctional DNase/RNase